MIPWSMAGEFLVVKKFAEGADFIGELNEKSDAGAGEFGDI